MLTYIYTIKTSNIADGDEKFIEIAGMLGGMSITGLFSHVAIVTGNGCR